MGRTRSSKAAAGTTKAESTTASKSKHTLPPETDVPSQLFVLPKQASKEAKIVSLPNPRYARPTRYLVCPETGIYEFTKITAPKQSPRSWFIETTPSPPEGTETESVTSSAQTMTSADLFVATVVDPLFLVLPALVGPPSTSKSSESPKRLFLSSDDHFDALPEDSSHLSEILRCPKTRSLIESRMEAACDTVDAGDEKMYRLSEKKLLTELLAKARRMSKGGLPSSMEEKFVKKALEAPVMIRQTKAVTEVAATATPASEASTPMTESTETQSSLSSAESAAVSFVSEASTTATSVTEETTEVFSAIQASEEVIALQRLQIAFNFICSSYVSPSLAEQLRAQLKDVKVTSTDFTPLDDYLASVAKLRAETAASRSVTDYSRKRMLDEEEEEARAEKRRKLEEEKRRKANESRGVRELKKVNTSGMKKLSDFFVKKK